MRKRHSAAAGHSVRPIRKAWLMLAKYRRIFLTVLLCLTVTSAGAIGYFMAGSTPAVAETIDDAASVAAFNDQVAAQNELGSTVEQLNLEKALTAEKKKNSSLANSLENQQKEMSGLEDTILNALMANLSDQLLSRSSSTVDSYSQEARNLLSLSRKLNAFEKTPEASEIDLTTYKAAIDKRLMRLPTLKPIYGGLDGYGWRIHPIFHYRQFHPAVDMGAPTGTPIKAAATGYVTEAGYSRTAGNFIKISHGNGFTTTYMHCSKLFVHAGETVTKGEKIGAVGSTGTSTTPHLHFEIRLYGNPVNPKEMIMEY